ncbi:type II secretion system protein [Thalassospira sp.]|uniref:type IV pilus modification PilV family protein n=1 Tax=Thalassospira sp. TaxID=1912094 RepID=UPI0032EAEEAD
MNPLVCFREFGVKGVRGFTLLESLIAITILALALVPIYGKFSDGVMAIYRSEEAAYGALYAQSYLASVGSLYSLENGRHIVHEDNGYEVDIHISDGASSREVNDNRRFSLFDVHVVVKLDARTVAELRGLKAKVLP